VQLEEGDGAPKNKKKKLKKQAQHNVGVQLAEGDGAPKNQRQAAEWYNKAVAAGQVRSTNKNKNKINVRPSLRGSCDGVGTGARGEGWGKRVRDRWWGKDGGGGSEDLLQSLVLEWC
jgi:hypothetical protein